MTEPLRLLFPSDIVEITDTLVPTQLPDVHLLTVLPGIKACYCSCGISAKMRTVTALWAVIVEHCVDPTEMSRSVHHAVRDLFARVLALTTARIGPYDMRVSYLAELVNSWANDIANKRHPQDTVLLLQDGIVAKLGRAR